MSEKQIYIVTVAYFYVADEDDETQSIKRIERGAVLTLLKTFKYSKLFKYNGLKFHLHNEEIDGWLKPGIDVAKIWREALNE